MKKNKIKIISTIIISILIISLTTTAFALKPSEVDVTGDLNDDGEMKEFGEKALGIIQTIGVVGSVVILIVAGIKYMIGTVEEKSDYKKALLPYIVGAVILFSATTIANIMYEIANEEQGNGDNGTELDEPQYEEVVRPGEDELHPRE